MTEKGSPLDAQELLPSHGGTGKELVPSAEGAPVRLALRRIRRDKVALAFAGLFLAIVALCLAAPLYARYVAHTGPNANHVTETIRVGGQTRDVVSLLGIPIGPTWRAHFLLGADFNGRDEAVRLLYGGRNSLVIGFAATAITMVIAVLIALVGGYYRNWVDAVLARLLDLIWAYPAVLLGVAIGASLTLGGISIGPVSIKGNSLYIPAMIIGFVNIPYVAKPIRGQVIALREKEFVDAARTLDAGSWRIMFSEILPNLSSTILVLIPLMIANSILLEAALSFLGAGVQAPNASWGTMISDGVQLITSSPHLVLVPGLTLILTVFSINVFGEGLRDVLDPHGSTRKR
jgi:peptide/nickel transport system permease protein